jgi:murein L,D-transpeptidase YcbB/YkuD
MLLGLFGAPNLFGAQDASLIHQVSRRIEQKIQATTNGRGFICGGEPICGIDLIPMFYQSRQFAPVWIDDHGEKPTVSALIRAISSCDDDGLNPLDYHLPAINALLENQKTAPAPFSQAEVNRVADLDLLLTDAYLLLSSHLSAGRVNPETLHSDWLLPERSIDMMEILSSADTESQLTKALENLRPAHAGYTGLKKALATLRQEEKHGSWPRIQPGETLRPGAQDPRVAVLRDRLMMSRDLSNRQTGKDANRFEPQLVQAVVRFQKRHGLKPDGVVGARTLEALNVSLGQRIRQVQLNMERWRWMPHDLGTRYIVVNIADFNLRVVENHQTVLEMKVVVGRPARRTPVFSAMMTYMVINPYWTVPRTIAIEDILPKLKAQGGTYLSEQNMEVFDGWARDGRPIDPKNVNWSAYNKGRFPFRLRQDPGPKNALGQIKFMFPNKFDVYLHDTPNRSPFSREQRDVSSGCIRVENAVALAAYLLKNDKSWPLERLKSEMETHQRQVIHIPRPIALHLLYLTAWVDEAGILEFREDIYRRDIDLNRALKQRPTAYPFED